MNGYNEIYNYLENENLSVITLTDCNGKFIYNEEEYNIEKNKQFISGKLEPKNLTNPILLIGPLYSDNLDFCCKKYEYYLIEDDAIMRKNVLFIGYNITNETSYIGRYTSKFNDVNSFRYWRVAMNTKIQKRQTKLPCAFVFDSLNETYINLSLFLDDMYLYSINEDEYNKYTESFNNFYDSL